MMMSTWHSNHRRYEGNRYLRSSSLLMHTLSCADANLAYRRALQLPLSVFMLCECGIGALYTGANQLNGKWGRRQSLRRQLASERRNEWTR